MRAIRKYFHDEYKADITLHGEPHRVISSGYGVRSRDFSKHRWVSLGEATQFAQIKGEKKKKYISKNSTSV